MINLAALRDALSRARSLPELGAAAAALGLSVADQAMSGGQTASSALLSFPAPIAATELCAGLGWQQAFAISGDVAQRRWQIQLWQADLPDPFQRRIHTRPPTIGGWVVVAWLGGRPAGPLPPSVAGAAPAYDLAAYPAAVVALEVRPAAG